MSENVIFCFSGTGNCLDIAKNIAKRMGDTDIIMMRKAPAVTDVSAAKRVGFVFPCYAGGLPGDVEKYAKTIKVKPKAYTFGVCSYAGYIGCGLYKLNSIIPLTYWAGVSHQCSCIWLFPHTLMMPPISPEKAQKRSEEKAMQIAIDALSFKRRKQPPKMSVNAVESRVAAAVQAKGPQAQGERRMYRLRPVREAVSQGQHHHRQRQSQVRQGLHPVPQLSPVLSQAGDIHGRRDRDARALP